MKPKVAPQGNRARRMLANSDKHNVSDVPRETTAETNPKKTLPHNSVGNVSVLNRDVTTDEPHRTANAQNAHRTAPHTNPGNRVSKTSRFSNRALKTKPLNSLKMTSPRQFNKSEHDSADQNLCTSPFKIVKNLKP